MGKICVLTHIDKISVLTREKAMLKKTLSPKPKIPKYLGKKQENSDSECDVSSPNTHALPGLPQQAQTCQLALLL